MIESDYTAKDFENEVSPGPGPKGPGIGNSEELATAHVQVLDADGKVTETAPFEPVNTQGLKDGVPVPVGAGIGTTVPVEALNNNGAGVNNDVLDRVPEGGDIAVGNSNTTGQTIVRTAPVDPNATPPLPANATSPVPTTNTTNGAPLQFIEFTLNDGTTKRFDLTDNGDDFVAQANAFDAANTAKITSRTEG
jgi:hypothetical protein